MKITRIVCIVMAFAIAGGLGRGVGLSLKTKEFFKEENRENIEKALSKIFTVDLLKYKKTDTIT